MAWWIFFNVKKVLIEKLNVSQKEIGKGMYNTELTLNTEKSVIIIASSDTSFIISAGKNTCAIYTELFWQAVTGPAFTFKSPACDVRHKESGRQIT